MTATRRFHIGAALFVLFLPVLASAATHEFRVLIDADNNTATGCALGGMTGVDQVVVTLVKTDATSGAVEKSYRLVCSGGSFGAPLDMDTTGWPVGYNPSNGGMLVENRVSYAALGGLPSLMRLGFDATSGSASQHAIALANGSPILYPAKRGKRHSVNSSGNGQRFFQLDGDGKDWGAIEPIVTGIASNGTKALRMISAYVHANPTDEFIYFRVDANVSSDAPFAEDDEYSRAPGQGLSVPAPGVLQNDGDPNGLPITATPVSDASHGDVTLNADGSFTYAPNDPASTQSDSFQYKATNGSQDSNVAKVTIKVSSVANNAPVAQNDSYNTNEDSPVNASAPGVLGNDSDADGDSLTATKLSDPSHGSVVVNGDGSFTYTPDPNFFGTDTFTYQVSDGEFTATATVTITIQSVNDPPTISDASFSIDENSPNGSGVGTVSAGDVEGDTLSFSITGGNTNGAFAINAATGQITVANSAALDFETTPVFTLTVTVTDSGAPNESADATITITLANVNDAPVAVNDSGTVAEDGTLTVPAPGLLANDSDQDGNTLTASKVSDPASGVATVNANGGWTYQPNPNASGTDSFTYHVTDGITFSNVATVTITITPVNDAPVNSVPGAQTTAEDTALTFSTGNGNAISISDIDAGTGNMTVTLTATNGTLTANAGASITNNGTASVILNGTFTQINASLSGLVFTPTANYFGAASLQIQTSDNGNTGSGGALSDTDSISITVTEVNDAPAATADSITTAEDTPNAFAAATLTTNDSAGPGNESGQTLTVTAVSATSAQGGTVTLVAGTITYTPPANYFGPDSFTYTVTDNGTTNGGADPRTANGTVNVTVTEVNDAPAANADAISTNEDTPSIFAASSLTTNDSAGPSNESTQTLTVTAVSPASAQGGTVTLVAGNITYTPPANYFGADSFTYTVTDNGTTNGVAAPLSAVGTVNVTVTAVNDAPVLTVTGSPTHTEGGAATNLATAANIVDVDDTNIESATIQITGNFAAGQDVLSFVNTPNISGSFVGSTLTLTGSDTKANYIAALQAVQYTNTSDTPSTLQRTITWTVNDGDVNSNTQTTTLDVTATNDAPVNNMPGAQTTAEDTPLTLTGVNKISITDVDADPDDVQVTLNVTNGTVTVNPSGVGALTSLTGDGTNTVVITGTVSEVNAVLDGMTFNATPNYNGAASIQVVTDDLGNNPSGNLTDTDTLNITVTAVNDAPVLSVTGSPSYTEDGAAVAIASSVNITDVDDTNIESAVVQITGNFDTGDTLNYVNMLGINGSYVAGTLTLTGSATKADYITALQSITFSTTSDTPSELQRTITWTVNDGDVNSNTQTTTVNVTANNDAPVLTNPASVSPTEDVAFSFTGGNVISVTDPDSGAGTNFQATLAVTNGTLSVTGSGVTGNGTNNVTITGTVAAVNTILGTLQYTGNLNFNGSDTLTVNVTDNGQTGAGGAQADSANITINVTAVNDAPVLTVTGSPSYTEDGSAVAIASSVNITDVDDTNIESAIVQISGNFDTGDTLNYVNMLGINGSYVGGTLTLTGSATKADYITALQSITFSSTSDTPSELQRTITWTVNDGDVNSNTQTTTVNVTANNDAPVLTNPASVSPTEDTAFAFTGGNAISVTDPDSGAGTNFQATLAVTNGTLSVTGSGVTGNGTNNVTITGTVAAVNTILGTLQYTGNLNFAGSDTLVVNVTDNGQTGAGGAQTDSANITINVANVNDAPVLTVTGSPTFAEGGAAVNVAATASITDVDDTNIESAVVQITGNFQSGADTLNYVNMLGINGSFVGDTLTLTGSAPKADYVTALQSITFSNGSDNPSTLQRTITWTVNDGDVNSNTQTTTVDVSAVNDGPTNTVPGGTPSTNEDTDLGGLVFSIADPDAGTADIDVQLTVTNGVITLNSIAGMSNYIAGDGTLDAFIHFQGPLSAWNNALNGITFRPSLNFVGTASIQIVTSDLGNTGTGGALTDNDTLNITVNAVNDPPVNGVPGLQTFNEDTVLTFSSGNGNAITVSDVDAAAGNLQVTLSTTAGTITLGGTTGLTVSGNGTGTVQATGTITDLNTGLNGTTFTPILNSNGAKTISMATSDLGNTGSGGAQTDNDTINLSITAVNDGPQNTVPGGQTMNQDTSFTFTGGTQISIADVDAGGSTVQVTLTGTNGTVTLSGTTGLSFSFSDANGTGAGDGTGDATMTFRGTITDINTALNNLQFTSTPGFFSGPNAQLDIVTNDLGNTGTGGALTDSDSVSIFVQQVNQAPVNTVPGLQTFNEDTTRTFSGGNANQISISDPDAGVATVQVTLTATNGTMSLNGVVGLSFVFSDGNGTGAGDGTADATMTFRGTIANINTALNGLVYTPNLNYNGAATITITTNDLGNTGPGGPMTDSDPITLSITAVNDGPVLTAPAAVAPAEDVQFSFTAGNAISVTDVDSGAGTNFQATLNVTSGTINVVAAGSALVGGNNTNAVTITGTVADVNSTLATTKYTGNLNFNGTDTLVVVANDNGQTGGGNLSDTKNVTLNVSAVNDAPINSFPGTQTFNEDTTLTFSTGNGNAISVSDVDVASGNMTVTLSTTAGTMTFGSVAGLSAVTNNAATITGTGTLANINNALQGLVFTPTLNINGPQTISLTISDLGNTGSGGTLTDNDTINLSITAVNDAPVLTNPASVNATEDVAFNFTNTVSIADVDAGASSVQVSLTATNGTVSLSGTAGLSFVFSDGNGTGAGDGTADATMTFRGTVTAINTALTNMTWTGTSNFNGTGSLAITVNDLGNTGTGGPLTDSDTVTVNVAAVNDPPVAQDKLFSAQAHMRINGLSGLLTGVTDPDNGTGPGPCVSTTFTVANLTPVTGGTVANLNTSAGTFDFIPAQNFTGTATLTYTVQDSGCPGNATSAAANIQINVAGPVIYFVKNPAVGTADCTLGNECLLATAIPLATAAADRHIFISDANSHAGAAAVLNTNGRFVGQGVTTPVDSDGVLTDDFDDLFDISPPSGTIARPSIAGTRPTVTNSAITMNVNSHVRGFNLTVNAGTALQATGRTGLRISDINIGTSSNNNGQWCLDLGTSSGLFNIGTITQNSAGNNGSGVRFATTTSTSTVTIGNISMQGTGQGFNGSSTGTTNFSFGNVTSAAGAAVTTNTSSGNFTFGNITSTTGAALSVTSSGVGDFTATNVTSTTGTAVSVTTATGDFTFTQINSNGAAKGVSVNSLANPGTFKVNGTGSTDGSGGTIQNATSRGMEFISSDNITLKNMNLTNNGVGGNDSNCADALGATTTGTFVTGANCESNLHLQTATTVSLDNLNITNGDAHGINGYQVNGLTMTNMLVEGNGDLVGEDGVQLVNTSGTVSLTGSNIFRDNAANQFEAQNGSGSPTFNISGAYFGLTNFPTTGAAEAPSPGSGTANSGLVISASGTANMTATVTGSTFEENYANGYLSDSAGSGVLNLTIGQAGVGNGNTFTNNGVPLEIVNAATGSTTYTVRNNTFTNDTAITGIFATSVITASRSGAGSTMTGTIDNNTIGLAGAGSTSSGCFVSLCNGIELTDSATSATNRYNVTVTNNQVNHVQGGITSNIGGSAGSPKTSFVITGNTVQNPDQNVSSQNNNAILINSGTDPTSTPQTCVEISSNTLNGAWGAGFNNDSLRLRHRGAAGSTFRIRNWDTSINYDGVAPTGDAADAMRFLENNNTFSGFVDKTGFQLVGSNVFTGGTGACP